MEPHTTALERAFELARSGRYPSLTKIRSQLRLEGYSPEQVTGRLLQSQLRKIINEALVVHRPFDEGH